ncbi:MAG: hypothetical protein SGBAC_012605 [Bacillariaceae sp.]
MRVSLSVLAAVLASNQRNVLLVSAFQPSSDFNRQHRSSQQHQDPNHPRQSSRLNDASAMPYLSSWKLLPEGNIQGIIFGHPSLEDGDAVTTSQITDSQGASENQIIQTESGSHYLLGRRDDWSDDEQIAIEREESFRTNVAAPVLGSAIFAAGAVGLGGLDGESARFDTAAPAQAFKEMSVASLSQFQNSAKSLGESIDMPYLASQVSEAEKQFQAATENMFKQKGPEFNNVAAPTVVANQEDAAQKFEQALSVAAKKVAIEKKALNELVAWEKFVDKEIAKEKVETEVMKSASSAAAKALSENNFDAAQAATERAQMARAAVMELQAERETAVLAEESAEAEELLAEQDVMKVISEIKQMASLYSAKVAGLKPTDALYYLEELRSSPVLGEYLSTKEGQTAVGSLLAAATTGAVWAGSFGTGKKYEEEEESAASAAASSTTKKAVSEPTPVITAAKSTTAPIASTGSNGAVAATAESTAVPVTHIESTETTTKSAWGSYLDVLGSYGSGAAVVPSSYSPFGRKSAGMTSHSNLYSPPGAEYALPVSAAPSSPTVSAATAETTTVTTTTTTTTTQTAAPTPIKTTAAHDQPLKMSGSSGYLDALSGPPGAAVMTSYSPFAPKSPASPKPEIAAHIRLAYKEWCEYYGKKSDDSRMQIFAKNFADAKEFYKESGRALLLNEYADLSASEYKLLPNAA